MDPGILDWIPGIQEWVWNGSWDPGMDPGMDPETHPKWVKCSKPYKTIGNVSVLGAEFGQKLTKTGSGILEWILESWTGFLESRNGSGMDPGILEWILEWTRKHTRNG